MPPSTTSGATRSRRHEVEKALFGLLNRVVAPLVRSGIGSPPPIGGGVVLVETTGHRSGRPRVVPLMTLRAGDKLVAATFRDGSHWVRNLEADPTAVVWLFGRKAEATASMRSGPLRVATLTLSD